MVDTIIVVSCYNEEQRLPAARFEDFLRQVQDVGFILVDSSPDAGVEATNSSSLSADSLRSTRFSSTIP